MSLTPPLILLHGPQTFQTFLDHQADGSQERPQQRHGSYRHIAEELSLLNKRGHGIYFTVNWTAKAWEYWAQRKVGTEFARKASDIVGIRAWYCDIDGLDAAAKADMRSHLLAHSVAPSCVIETKNGLHCYWYADQPLGVDWMSMEPSEYAAVEKTSYERIERGLNTYWGGDQNVKDVARVMRVPGFLHVKDPDDPFLVTVAWDSPTYYSEAQMLAAFPAPEAKAPVVARAVRDDSTGADWSRVLDALAEWPATTQGTRHKVMLLACGVGRKFGRSRTEVEADLAPIVASWATGRNMIAELANAVRWAFLSGDLATVSALRGEGVDVPKLSHPNAGEG